MSTKFKLIFGAFAFLAIISSLFVGCERIDAGNVGIKVNMTGGNQGVARTEYVTGWCYYWRLAQKVYEFPTFQQHKEYEPYDVPTKGGTVFTVHPTFNYNLNAGNVGDMFQKFRVSLKNLEEGFLKTSMTTAIREVTNTFTVDSILNNQAGYDAAILEKLNKELHPYFQVTQFTANLTPDPKLKDAISNKAKAIQEAQAKLAEVTVAEANAKIELTNARKDSAVKVMTALAEARAIREKQEVITSQYVEYTKWVNASPDIPRVPSTVLGSSSNYLYSPK